MTGCSDFLLEDNKSNVVADEFYTSRAGYESLINTTYSELRDIYSEEPWVYVAGTDMYVEGRDSQPQGISEYRNLTPDNDIVADYYRNLYEAIQMCNTALYYNERTEEAPTLQSRKGEVKFLRAFFYFHLVRSFGGVSIVTDRIAEPVISFERDSAEEVYAFVISEMEDALNLVPEDNDYGRVNKRTIRHFLAKVHLARGYESFAAGDDFNQAATYADNTIDGQGLNLTHEQVFFPGNEENEEIIFSVQYDKSSMIDPSDDGHMQSLYWGPYHGGEGAIFGYPYRDYTLCPTMYVFDLYTEDDARFHSTFMVEFYERYYDYFDQAGTRGDLNVQYYYPPEWAVSDTTAWRLEDPEHRSDATIIPYSPAWEASPQTQSDNATPAVKKFDDPTAVFSNDGSSSRDIFLARLGETYLIAAEAYFQAGDPATAAARINEVRTRAALPGSEAAMMIQPADVDIDFILDERARELVGEYHRWFDLKRTAKLVERTQLYNRDIKDWFDSGINPFMRPDGNLKILRPIPQEAIDLNEANIQQNPGY